MPQTKNPYYHYAECTNEPNALGIQKDKQTKVKTLKLKVNAISQQPGDKALTSSRLQLYRCI